MWRDVFAAEVRRSRRCRSGTCSLQWNRQDRCRGTTSSGTASSRSRVAPHPDLTPAQSRAIAIDYGLRGSSASIKVRRALLFYALKRLGLDVSPDARPAREQHIVLVNRDDVEAARVARAET
jgi:hypothetical protein